MIFRTLPPGVLVIWGAAVGTDKFYCVLLRIAVQSSPASAANSNCFNALTAHWLTLLGCAAGKGPRGSTSSLMRCGFSSRGYEKILYVAIFLFRQKKVTRGTCFRSRCQTL